MFARGASNSCAKAFEILRDPGLVNREGVGTIETIETVIFAHLTLGTIETIETIIFAHLPLGGLSSGEVE